MFFKIVGAVVVVVGGCWLAGVLFSAFGSLDDSQAIRNLPWCVSGVLTGVMTAMVVAIIRNEG